MKVLLQIEKPKDRSFIFWEHLLRSVVAFVGTFALLFFGPIMFGSKSRGDSKDGLTYQILHLLLEHPEIHVGLSFLAVLIVNGYLIFKNKKLKYVVKIELDSYTIQFELTNLYYSKKQKIDLPVGDFEFYLENTVTKDLEKKQKLIFRYSGENKSIGEIDPKHVFWADDLLQLRSLIEELKPYRKENINVNSAVRE